MDKQLVADRLSGRYGVHVSVGLYRSIEDVRGEAGKLVRQIANDDGERFVRADGVAVPQADIDAETSETLALYPSGQKTPTKAERMQAALAENNLVQALIGREAKQRGMTVTAVLDELADGVP